MAFKYWLNAKATDEEKAQEPPKQTNHTNPSHTEPCTYKHADDTTNWTHIQILYTPDPLNTQQTLGHSETPSEMSGPVAGRRQEPQGEAEPPGAVARLQESRLQAEHTGHQHQTAMKMFRITCRRNIKS